MDRLMIPEELQISVYHEGVLLLIGYSEHKDVINKIAKAKRSGQLIEDIISLTREGLLEKYQIETLSTQDTQSWKLFLKELQIKSQHYEEFHPLVLAAVVELMNELNWQDQLNLRKLLTLFLHTDQEFAHFRIAASGTDYIWLDQWRDTIIEDSKGYAAYKTKQVS